MIGKIAKISALAAALSLPVMASAQQDLSNPKSAFEKPAEGKNWSAEAKRTERGHLVGNPDAETQMIEFVSYTCGACLAFAKQGEPALNLTVLRTGEMNVEVRPVIRNYLDLTVSLLVACGDEDGFKARHRDFMWSQDMWLKKAIAAPQSQQAIWQRANKAARISMASALDLDDKLIAGGASASEVTACLSDDVAAQALIDNSNADRTEFGVRATPSFALNGKLLPDVHQWASLYPVLSNTFAPTPTVNAFGSQGD